MPSQHSKLSNYIVFSLHDNLPSSILLLFIILFNYWTITLTKRKHNCRGMTNNCDMFDSTPPWLLGRPQSYMEDVSLHDEIQLFCKWISPTRVRNPPLQRLLSNRNIFLAHHPPHNQITYINMPTTKLFL